MRIIAGESRGRKLRTVKRAGTRPTMDRVRESLFAILTPWMEGARFLDLYAGTGSVGLEALSRAARQAVFVDSNHGCAGVIRENLDLLGRKADGMVIGRPCASALNQLGGQSFDIIFADPPYQQEAALLKLGEKISEIGLLAPGGWLVLQHTMRLVPPQQFGPGEEITRVDERKFGETRLTFYRRTPLTASGSAAAPLEDDAP